MGFVLLVKSLRDKNYCIKLLKTLYVAAWQLVDSGSNVVSKALTTNDPNIMISLLYDVGLL